MAKTEHVKAQSGGRRSIDAGMAALAALSLGFFGYAMPSEVARRMVGASSIAEPGSSARYAALAAAAALAFILTYALLRALGRAPAKAKPADVPADPPRIRRADAHPDAPARWPLFAGSELGDPIPAEAADPVADELELQPEEIIAEEPEAEVAVETTDEPDFVEEVEAPEAAGHSLLGLLGGVEISEGEPVERAIADEVELDHPLPSFIPPPAEEAPAEPFPVQAEIEPIERPVSVEAVEAFEDPAPEPDEAVDDRAAREAEPVAEQAPYVDEWVAREDAPAVVVDDATDDAPVIEAEKEPAPTAESAFVPGTWEDPFAEAGAEAPLEVAEEVSIPAEYESVPERSESAPDLVEADPIEIEPAAVEPEPVAAIAARILPEPRDESVSELMGRLEVGLGRRDRAHWLGDPDSDAGADAPTDDRLRNALGMLKRMAGRKP